MTEWCVKYYFINENQNDCIQWWLYWVYALSELEAVKACENENPGCKIKSLYNVETNDLLCV